MDEYLSVFWLLVGLGLGFGLGGLLSYWSLKRFPEYWIKWIMENTSFEGN